MPSILRTNYALLMFYVREKLWRHAEIVCNDTIKTTDSWIFRVWHALCLDQQGQPNEALREYKSAEQRRETVIPALKGIAMIYRRNKDADGLAAAERALSDDRHADNIDGWIQAAALTWAAGDVNEARDILMRFQDGSEDHRDECTNFATLRAWIDLSTGRGAFLEKCGTLFRKVMEMEMSDGQMDIDATMGRVAYFERKYQFSPAQELLSKLIVGYPNFTPALIVKARHLMKAEDWEQCAETTKRILAKDKTNVEALALNTLFLLVKDARYEAASNQLPRLLEALQEREPKNAALFYEYAQCFSRLGGGHLPLLGVTLQFAETAHRMAPQNGDYLAEVGYEQMYRGDYKTALTTFKKALTFADSSITPLLGLIRCLIFTGNLDEATQQIEFPNEIQGSNQRNAELSLLNAILKWRKQKHQAKTLLFLDQAADAVKQDVAASPTGMDLYIKLNPPLMLELAKEYMNHCRTEPPDSANYKKDPIAEKCKRHLELLLRHIPGCLEGQLLLSKIFFVSGDLMNAQSLILTSIRHEHTMPEAYLLSAQLCQYLGNATMAHQALEQALTMDFEVKDQPHYNLLQGIVLGMMEKYQQALEPLELALKLSKEKTHMTAKGRPLQPLSVQDHVGLYLQLAQTYFKLHNVEDARATIAEASALFKDTTQAGRVTIASAMVAARTDVEKALEILRQVTPRSEFYVAARTRMANLYLVHRQNRIKYAECFEQMVEEVATSESYLELGEAYARIQEPDKAIAAYEKAKELDPDNKDLAIRIGRALVSTHDYQRAIRYYRDAVAGGGNKAAVRADLATLCWHLGGDDRAVQVLKDSPAYQSEPDPSEDVSVSIERVNCALLMYKVLLKKKPSFAAEALIQARTWQEHVLRHMMRNETRETLYQQKSVAALIAVELGSYSNSVGNIARAKEYYEEALKHDESNEAALLGIASLLLESDNMHACEEQCNVILRINPACEEAVVILADIMVRHDRFEDAASHFQQLLQRKPDNTDALIKYVDLMRYAGQLSKAKTAIEAAEALVPAGERPDSGIYVAQGLYARYRYDNADALRAFNSARLGASVGPQWAEVALANMVEMYITPTNEDIWVDTQLRGDEKNENVKIADRLLLQMSPGDRRDVLQAYCWIVTKKKPLVERAIKRLSRICTAYESTDSSKPRKGSDKKEEKKNNEDDQDEDEDEKLLENADATADTLALSQTSPPSGRVHIRARVGLAIAFYIAGLEKRAMKEVQHVVDLPFSPQSADAVHTSRLLAAHISIARKEYDMARMMLDKALKYNKGCSRAWVGMGFLRDLEKNHAEAAHCYEKAWELTNERDPVVGYNLAFHLMKSSKVLQAIDVCRSVLQSHPNYPKMNEIIEACQKLLRP